MKKFKKTLTAIAIIFAVLIPGSYALASGSSEYDSTYSMTGGVFGKWITTGASPTATVILTPSTGDSAATITVFIQKKTDSGYTDVASKAVSSTKSSTSKFSLSKKGTYRVYLRDYAGQKMSGDITVKFKW